MKLTDLAKGVSIKFRIDEGDEEWDDATNNSNLVINAFVGIEKQMCSLIEQIRTNKTSPKQASFNSIKSSLIKLIKGEELLSTEEQDCFKQHINFIQLYRNAFAHGEFSYEMETGIFINYFSNGKQNKLLNDEYWQEVQDAFDNVSEIFKKVRTSK